MSKAYVKIKIGLYSGNPSMVGEFVQNG